MSKPSEQLGIPEEEFTDFPWEQRVVHWSGVRFSHCFRDDPTLPPEIGQYLREYADSLPNKAERLAMQKAYQSGYVFMRDFWGWLSDRVEGRDREVFKLFDPNVEFAPYICDYNRGHMLTADQLTDAVPEATRTGVRDALAARDQWEAFLQANEVQMIVHQHPNKPVRVDFVRVVGRREAGAALAGFIQVPIVPFMKKDADE